MASAESVEVWTPTGSDPTGKWEHGKALKKSFDKDVRGYVVELPPQLGAAPKPVLHGAQPLESRRGRRALRCLRCPVVRRLCFSHAARTLAPPAQPRCCTPCSCCRCTSPPGRR